MVTELMQNTRPLTGQRRMPPLKRALYAGAAVGVLVLGCLLILLLFPDPFVNRLIKPGIVAAFSEAYPAYSIRISNIHYSFMENRFDCDSVALSAVDGTFSGTAGPLAVSGVAWIHLLWGGSLAAEFASARADVHDIVLAFPQPQYEVRCGLLSVSLQDSVIIIESLAVHPSGDDEQFFAESKFRKTRFHLVVPNVKVMGVECLEMIQSNKYCARSAHIHDAFIDVLINKDKPSSRDTVRPPMPNEILALMEQAVEVESVTIWNGGIKYGERFEPGSIPAVITMDSLQVSVRGIDNHAGTSDTVVIRAEGEFMKSAEMSILMSIPISAPEFSFQYSGSVGRMDVRALNPFLEKAEQMRIKAGVLQAAQFQIVVASGHASGTVRAVYRDLSLAVINKHTGSERGFFDGITSFMANTFKIRGTNEPDESGAVKIGKVKYVRQRNDPFFRFVWFALRSGLGDVVGF